MWQDLIDILGNLVEIYDNLAKLGEKKRSALINADIKELSSLLDEENLIISKVQLLEQRRIELFKSLSQSNISETMSAKVFYKMAPSSVAGELFELHERLFKKVQLALKIRDDNQVLAQCALDSAQMKLNKIAGATIEPTYSGKGSDIITHQKNFDFMA